MAAAEVDDDGAVRVPERRRRRSAMGRFRARVRALPGGRIVWRIAVTLIGTAVIAIGIVLLPLPGPGWVIIFAGLGILASEYRWAARLLRFVRRLLQRWTAWLERRSLWLRIVVVLFSVIVVLAIVAAAWWVAGHPGL